MSEGTMTVGGIFYFYPAKFPDPRFGMWQQGLTNPAVEYFVANPGSGPGGMFDPNYKLVIDAGRAAGKVPIAYIATDYGRIPEAFVKSQIEKYRAWYSVDSCFFDECASDITHLDYYKRLYEMVFPGRVVINPGVVPAEGYVKCADTICLFESTIDKWNPASWPAWIRTYPRDKWFAIVMGCNQSQAESVCKSGAYVGSIYPIERIDSPTVDGFEVLPPYFSMIPRWLKIPEPTVSSPTNPTDPGANNQAVMMIREIAEIIGMGPDSTQKDVPAKVKAIVDRNNTLETKVHLGLLAATDEEILADVARRLKR